MKIYSPLDITMTLRCYPSGGKSKLENCNITRSNWSIHSCMNLYTPNSQCGSIACRASGAEKEPLTCLIRVTSYYWRAGGRHIALYSSLQRDFSGKSYIIWCDQLLNRKFFDSNSFWTLAGKHVNFLLSTVGRLRWFLRKASSNNSVC